MDVTAVRKKMALECERAGGVRKWAADNELSQPYVTLAMNGRQDPGPKILKVLGLKKVISYRKANGS